MATKRDPRELLLIEEADAWFEYLAATRSQLRPAISEIEPRLGPAFAAAEGDSDEARPLRLPGSGAAAGLGAMLMQTVLSHSTQRATHRNPGGQGARASTCIPERISLASVVSAPSAPIRA